MRAVRCTDLKAEHPGWWYEPWDPRSKPYGDKADDNLRHERSQEWRGWCCECWPPIIVSSILHTFPVPSRGEVHAAATSQSWQA